MIERHRRLCDTMLAPFVFLSFLWATAVDFLSQGVPPLRAASYQELQHLYRPV